MAPTRGDWLKLLLGVGLALAVVIVSDLLIGQTATLIVVNVGAAAIIIWVCLVRRRSGRPPSE